MDFAKHGASSLILHYLGDEETEKEVQSLQQELEKQHVRAVVVAGDIADSVTSSKVLSVSPIAWRTAHLVIPDCRSRGCGFW